MATTHDVMRLKANSIQEYNKNLGDLLHYLLDGENSREAAREVQDAPTRQPIMPSGFGKPKFPTTDDHGDPLVAEESEQPAQPTETECPLFGPNNEDAMFGEGERLIPPDDPQPTAQGGAEWDEAVDAYLDSFVRVSSQPCVRERIKEYFGIPYANLAAERDRLAVDAETLHNAGWELIDPNVDGQRIWKPPLGRRPDFELMDERDRLKTCLDKARRQAREAEETAEDRMQCIFRQAATIRGLRYEIDRIKNAVNSKPQPVSAEQAEDETIDEDGALANAQFFLWQSRKPGGPFSNPNFTRRFQIIVDALEGKE